MTDVSDATGILQVVERPLCTCHGEPMATRGKKRGKGRERFECVISKRERVRRWKRENRDKVREQKARRLRSPDGIAATNRYRRGSGYLVRRQRELSAQRERITNQLEGIRHGTE